MFHAKWKIRHQRRSKRKNKFSKLGSYLNCTKVKKTNSDVSQEGSQFGENFKASSCGSQEETASQNEISKSKRKIFKNKISPVKSRGEKDFCNELETTGEPKGEVSVENKARIPVFSEQESTEPTATHDNVETVSTIVHETIVPIQREIEMPATIEPEAQTTENDVQEPKNANPVQLEAGISDIFESEAETPEIESQPVTPATAEKESATSAIDSTVKTPIIIVNETYLSVNVEHKAETRSASPEIETQPATPATAEKESATSAVDSIAEILTNVVQESFESHDAETPANVEYKAETPEIVAQEGDIPKPVVQETETTTKVVKEADTLACVDHEAASTSATFTPETNTQKPIEPVAEIPTTLEADNSATNKVVVNVEQEVQSPIKTDEAVAETIEKEPTNGVGSKLSKRKSRKARAKSAREDLIESRLSRRLVGAAIRNVLNEARSASCVNVEEVSLSDSCFFYQEDFEECSTSEESETDTGESVATLL